MIFRVVTDKFFTINQMGKNLNFGAPHLGQRQLSGRSSKAVPGGVLVRGSPTSGS